MRSRHGSLSGGSCATPVRQGVSIGSRALIFSDRAPNSLLTGRNESGIAAVPLPLPVPTQSCELLNWHPSATPLREYLRPAADPKVEPTETAL
jgi:hypothetical protein